MKYDHHFYETIRTGTISSAEALVPQIINRLDIPPGARVIDIGCGEGWWAEEFTHYGCDIIGLDGDYHDSHRLDDRFIPHNVNNPLPEHLAGRFDVVICLEVAEHIQPKRAEAFVAELCSIAPIVIFSAAIPGQGGTGHVNEQWPDYWARLFHDNDFEVDDLMRFEIWDDDRIENWYRQNLLIATKGAPDEFIPPMRLVHPVLWNARR